MRGQFISLEGIDGAGKSTHMAWLIDTLKARGLTVISTREPGGTPLGEKLRELLLHEPMHIDTEALIMFAARKEHLERVIHPALARGDWVVSDRFTDASYAYQGGGRRLPIPRIAALEQWVHAGFQPDVTLLFDLPPETAAQRVRHDGRDAPDRFEQETLDFFTRVRDAYLTRAAQEPKRFHILDATKSVREIQNKLEEIFSNV